jgi:predicted MPP superfamily phosphohydrolase
MRNPLLFYVIVTVVVLLIDVYAFQAVKTASKDYSAHTRNIVKYGYWLFTAVLLLSVYSVTFMDAFHLPRIFRTYYYAVLLLIMVSKLFIVFFLILDDAGRGVRWATQFFQQETGRSGNGISRSKFISQLAIFVGLLPLVLGTHGMISGAYNYQVRRVRMKLPNLPDSFNGLKVIQLSDIHSGSFATTKPLIKAIDIINKEAADMIFFTGDLVNNVATEMIPYKDIFGQLKAKEGVFSVLGNHDYGDYFRWDNKEEKTANLQLLKDIQKEMGWQLLLDENRMIQRGNDKIAVLGVQNWSSKMNFPKYGNLEKTYKGCEDAPVKLLLSHDPSHWDAQIKPQFPDIDVTFSGHTHGAQLGVEIPGIRWSPSKYFYEQWADLYQSGKQYLYVNRGFGFLGYPGRIGIMPEITVFELHNS